MWVIRILSFVIALPSSPPPTPAPLPPITSSLTGFVQPINLIVRCLCVTEADSQSVNQSITFIRFSWTKKNLSVFCHVKESQIYIAHHTLKYHTVILYGTRTHIYLPKSKNSFREFLRHSTTSTFQIYGPYLWTTHYVKYIHQYFRLIET